MIHTMIRIGMLATLCLLNAYCAKSETEETISISAASLKFTAESETKIIDITTKSSWSAEGPEWVTLSPENGKGDGSGQQVAITVLQNKGNERTGTLTFTLNRGKKCAITLTQAEYKAKPENTLNGKNFIICANSMVYYGGLVEYGAQSKEDTGMFYKMLKDKGYSGYNIIDCTYGNHKLSDYTEAGCKTEHKDCPGVGVDLLKGLDLKSFDYVIISEAGNNNSNFYNDAMTLFNRFTSVNKNVKLIYINHIYSVYKDHQNILSQLKRLHEQGVTIINCGQLAYDIYTGAVKVPGGTVEYKDRYTFCNHTGSDTHHPNPLMGYIMTQMLYNALSGDNTPDNNWKDLIKSCKYSSSPIPYDNYYAKYYTTPADVPYMTIIENDIEMKGIQELIPKYIDRF